MIDADTLKSIEDLHRLKTEGVITQDEFERSKERLLFGKPSATLIRNGILSGQATPIQAPAPDDHIGWIILALRRWSDFKGRTGRKEYWMFQLVPLAVLVALFFAIVGSFDGYGDVRPFGVLVAAILALALLPLLIPQVSAQVRRLHDQGRSGWFVLINLLPYVGSVIVLVLMLIPGTAGDNEYGTDPRHSSTF